MIIAFAACSAGSGNSAVKIYCATGAFGCHCQNTDFTLGANETPTPDCNTPPEGAQCSFNRDATGASTHCDCATWHCFGNSTNDCVCSWYGSGTAPGSGMEVDSCVKNPSSTPGYPSWCCNAGYQCSCGTDSPTAVTSCTPNATVCTTAPGPGSNSAASCSGVQWAPPPRPSGGGSGGSTCTPGRDCSGDVDCCPGERCIDYPGYSSGSCG
jgi:hypothetical protein